MATNISKHYDSRKTEVKWLKFWEQKKIYRFSPKKLGKVYSVDTPPPTVSGKMHIGHAYSYTHFDFISRYQRMKGKNVFFPFGTDDNGLPTERLVEKLNNVRSNKMERRDFINLCNKVLRKIRPDFIKDWKNVGMSCDFTKVYSTIDDSCRRISQKMFIDLYKKKKVFRQEAPVVWCPHCQTAIAQAELEDQEQQTFFNDLKFELEKGKYIAISTTRPELLGSCVAVFVHPKDKRYKNLVGKKVKVPIFNQWVEIRLDRSVKTDKGTGAVMCCTFGDKADVEWFKKYRLPLVMSVNKAGRMTGVAKRYGELPVAEARKKILDDLGKKKLLLAQRKISHTVNVHDRCKTSVEILNSTQWYISVLDRKKRFLDLGRKIKWHPGYMRSRYENWVKNLSWDWAISRQRFFGVPFPLWYCEKCGEIKLADVRHLPVDPISDTPVGKCQKCGNSKFIAEKDVMDTWATSSLSPQLALQLFYSDAKAPRLIPMSLRPQAHDIISTWLFYTVVRSNYHFWELPWKEVMISGHVLDKRGQKMSKSLGNVVEPQEILEKYGTDALRFWTAGRSLGQDINYSEEDIRAGSKLLTKLWNVSRFVFMNCPQKVARPKKIYPSDQWILAEAQNLVAETTKNLEKYEFGLAKIAVEKFFWTKLTDNYIELIKGRLYGNTHVETGLKPATARCGPTEKIKNEDRQSAQYAIIYLLDLINHLLAPYLPFITEEIYQTFFKNKYHSDISIHLRPWPKLDKEQNKKALLKTGLLLVQIIEEIRRYKAGKGLKLVDPITSANITGSEKIIKSLKPFESDLKNVGKIKKINWKIRNINSLEFHFKP